MDIQQLRHSLKIKWLLYYRQHRPWLIQIRTWGTYDGQRRPSSSFILAALTNLEPQLVEAFPFIVALNSDPDKIVAALGLNFNPETELQYLTEALPVAENEALPAYYSNGNGKGNNGTEASLVAQTNDNGNGLPTQMLPTSVEVNLTPPTHVSNLSSWVDESCRGSGWDNEH